MHAQHQPPHDPVIPSSRRSSPLSYHFVGKRPHPEVVAVIRATSDWEDNLATEPANVG